MKKLFKLLSLLKLVKELRGHRGYRGHGHGRSYGHGGHEHYDHWQPRSRSHHPLYQRHGYRRSLADRLIGRLLHGRRS